MSNFNNIRQSRPYPILLGTDFVLKFNIYVNDGNGQVSQSILPDLSLATMGIYDALGSMTIPLTSISFDILTIMNGQQLLITLSTSQYPLTGIGEWIGNIVATRNGIPSEQKTVFFNTVELENVFANGCNC